MLFLMKNHGKHGRFAALLYKTREATDRIAAPIVESIKACVLGYTRKSITVSGNADTGAVNYGKIYLVDTPYNLLPWALCMRTYDQQTWLPLLF